MLNLGNMWEVKNQKRQPFGYLLVAFLPSYVHLIRIECWN